ncbi:F-actin-monooxygenase MICAL3-like isoform X1 [Brassica rapa]|uniref:F-actin-monooxygenase MICAL3-like isoform X1 n=1 Tax=Brassica campestris TaxID=3711 RepID=UPI00142D53FD|nr:F-actin-monooxygenase MICAL3-like isoform X1 [Brassica rapa]
MFSYNRRHWSTKQDIRQICTAKPLRSKHKMKKNNKRKLMLNSVTVIKKEKHQKSMKGIHLRKNKKNKWKLIQKLKSPCKLKGRNEEEEVSHHNTVLEQEHKKNKEKRKDEAYEKAKEKFQDEDGSKLDKLIQMLYDLNKQVEVIENVLGVADGYESPCNYDDTKGAPNDENEEEEISGGKRNATDDENDEEEISDTQQLTEVNILRENENT